MVFLYALDSNFKFYLNCKSVTFVHCWGYVIVAIFFWVPQRFVLAINFAWKTLLTTDSHKSLLVFFHANKLEKLQQWEKKNNYYRCNFNQHYCHTLSFHPKRFHIHHHNHFLTSYAHSWRESCRLQEHMHVVKGREKKYGKKWMEIFKVF